MILGDNKYYINYKTLLYLFIVAYKYSKRFIQQVVQLAVWVSTLYNQFYNVL